MGVAIAKGKKVHAWEERHSPSVEIPRLLEQVTTYREFEPTVQGILKLTDEVPIMVQIDENDGKGFPPKGANGVSNAQE